MQIASIMRKSPGNFRGNFWSRKELEERTKLSVHARSRKMTRRWTFPKCHFIAKCGNLVCETTPNEWFLRRNRACGAEVKTTVNIYNMDHVKGNDKK